MVGAGASWCNPRDVSKAAISNVGQKLVGWRDDVVIPVRPIANLFYRLVGAPNTALDVRRSGFRSASFTASANSEGIRVKCPCEPFGVELIGERLVVEAHADLVFLRLKGALARAIRPKRPQLVGDTPRTSPVPTKWIVDGRTGLTGDNVLVRDVAARIEVGSKHFVSEHVLLCHREVGCGVAMLRVAVLRIFDRAWAGATAGTTSLRFLIEAVHAAVGAWNAAGTVT